MKKVALQPKYRLARWCIVPLSILGGGSKTRLMSRRPADEESQGQLQNVLCRKPYGFKLLRNVDSILEAPQELFPIALTLSGVCFW